MVSFSRVIGIYAAVLGTANALSLRLNGVNYDLRQGPDWDPNKCKSGPIIKDDLQHLQQITSHIRTYSLGDCDVRPVLTYAKDKNMKVWLGVWVSADEAVYMKEVETLESLLADGLIDDTVIGFNVGSEAVYRGDITAEQAVSYANNFREILRDNNIDAPVSIADVGDMLVLYPQLIEASDVVCANAFPFWENIEASKAAAYFKKRFQPILDLAGNKKVIITETGWATSGKHENASIASEENAGRYLNDFVALAQKEKWDYYYFAAFDTNWKAAQEGNDDTVEAHFGLFDKKGDLKPAYNFLKVKENAVVNTDTASDGSFSGKKSSTFSDSTSTTSGSSQSTSTSASAATEDSTSPAASIDDIYYVPPSNGTAPKARGKTNSAGSLQVTLASAFVIIGAIMFTTI